MSNKFNARLSFMGDGELTLVLPLIGELTIWSGRDVYIKGANQDIIEYLRQCRSMKLEHKLNGDAKGCAKVIDVNEFVNSTNSMFRATMIEREQAKRQQSIAELKAQMIKSDDFIPVEEAGQENAESLQEKEDLKNAKLKEDLGEKEDEEDKELVKNDEKEESKELPEELANYVVKTTNAKGKKLSELDERAIRKLARYSTNETEKAKAKEALEILYPSNN